MDTEVYTYNLHITIMYVRMHAEYKLVSHFNCHVFNYAFLIGHLYINLIECVLLDIIILVGHLREMHRKWPVDGHLLFCTLTCT